MSVIDTDQTRSTAVSMQLKYLILLFAGSSQNLSAIVLKVYLELILFQQKFVYFDEMENFKLLNFIYRVFPVIRNIICR